MTTLREGWVDLSTPDVAEPSPRPTVWDLALYVPGAPVQKGSMRGRVVGKGHKAWAQLFHDNERAQHDWVRQAAASLSLAAGMPAQPWTGAVHVWALAVLPRPGYLTRVLHHVFMIEKPDTDKLARSVLDVLTLAGVYGDDKQVTHVECEKRYTVPGEAPGLHLRVARLSEGKS